MLFYDLIHYISLYLQIHHIFQYNKSRAVTLKNQQIKYGEKLGKEKFESYCKKQSYVGCKLEYFIEKYGEFEGTKKYNELNRKKALTLDNFIRIYGKQMGEEKFFEYKSKEHNFYSKISKTMHTRRFTA